MKIDTIVRIGTLQRGWQIVAAVSARTAKTKAFRALDIPKGTARGRSLVTVVLAADALAHGIPVRGTARLFIAAKKMNVVFYDETGYEGMEYAGEKTEIVVPALDAEEAKEKIRAQYNVSFFGPIREVEAL